MLLFCGTENHCTSQSYSYCLECLKQLEQDLNSFRVQIYWQQQSLDLANQFLQHQRDLMMVRAAFEAASPQQIEANLSKFEIVLSNECVTSVKHSKRLESAIAFLTSLADVIRLATRIVQIN